MRQLIVCIDTCVREACGKSPSSFALSGLRVPLNCDDIFKPWYSSRFLVHWSLFRSAGAAYWLGVVVNETKKTTNVCHTVVYMMYMDNMQNNASRRWISRQMCGELISTRKTCAGHTSELPTNLDSFSSDSSPIITTYICTHLNAHLAAHTLCANFTSFERIRIYRTIFTYIIFNVETIVRTHTHTLQVYMHTCSSRACHQKHKDHVHTGANTN